MSAAARTITSNKLTMIAGVRIGRMTRTNSHPVETPWMRAASVQEGDRLPTARIIATAAMGRKRRPKTNATVNSL